jgi:hypothetical protein
MTLNYGFVQGGVSQFSVSVNGSSAVEQRLDFLDDSPTRCDIQRVLPEDAAPIHVVQLAPREGGQILLTIPPQYVFGRQAPVGPVHSPSRFNARFLLIVLP